MTDKQLEQRTKSRLRTLKKAGLESDVTKLLENQLDILFPERDRKGFSFKQLDTNDRRILRRSLNQFIKNPLSTKTGIEKAFNHIKAEGEKNVPISEQLERLSDSFRIAENVRASKKYGYDVVQKAHKYVSNRFGKKTSAHNLVRDVMRDTYINDKFAGEDLTGEQKYNRFLRELKKRLEG